MNPEIKGMFLNRDLDELTYRHRRLAAAAAELLERTYVPCKPQPPGPEHCAATALNEVTGGDRLLARPIIASLPLGEGQTIGSWSDAAGKDAVVTAFRDIARLADTGPIADPSDSSPLPIHDPYFVLRD